MNSEIYTGTNRIYKTRRAKKRRGSILPAAVLAAAVLLLCAGYFFFRDRGFRNPYVLASRSAALVTEERNPVRAAAFASDLCVVKDTADHDSSIAADSGILCSGDGGTALYAKNVFAKMNPASTTKIMTCLIALEKGKLTDTVSIGDEIVMKESGVSMAGLKIGDRLTMEQLLYGLMLPSGADCANAVAVHISGSIPAFAELMNARAKEIGATGTHFTNAEGLTDDQHYTTAYDMYLILHEAMKNETFRKITSTRSYKADFTGTDGNPASLSWTNTNLYITGKDKEPEGLTPVGGKTGTTLAAGSCLALASRTKSGASYLSVIFHAPKREVLYENMTALLEKIAQ